MKKEFIDAIKVDQPLGSFFIAKIKAKDLLNISFSEPLEYKSEDGQMKGNQRKIDDLRLKAIGKYIDTAEMTFPNSIIISVNQNTDGSYFEENEERWEIIEHNGKYQLSFPINKKSASIIDGQHRINGFNYIKNQERLNIDIVCSIFFELPNPYQAYLFATINGNQKPVDKSLALEQFGYYVAHEDPESWTPEKLAANITRHLNFKDGSPLHGKIKLAPLFKNETFYNKNLNNWIVSTATIMEGILSLISSNYKRDRIEMMNVRMFQGRDRKMIAKINDNSPLRNLFLSNQDTELENILFDFFNIVNDALWNKADEKSYINKTIGIQALFQYLKEYFKSTAQLNKTMLNHASKIDFSDNYFQASGIGKTRIKNVLLISGKLMSLNKISSDADKIEISRILGLS